MTSIVDKYYNGEISDSQLLKEINFAQLEWLGSKSELTEYLGLCHVEMDLLRKSPYTFLAKMKAQKESYYHGYVE